MRGSLLGRVFRAGPAWGASCNMTARKCCAAHGRRGRVQSESGSVAGSSVRQRRNEEITMIHTFTAVIHAEGDLYVAGCPEVGTVSQGHSFEAALANLAEAT